ncbi:glycosyltransferase [Tundrisphaera lichenicola]|uniref:glycosyltransferase n=1 Tax=Tundrisphaera lichenicola TaxID=2029860 RepID=UPI003EB7BD31
MNLFLLTIGTRGDVQPFVALGRALQRLGHEVTVCTSSGFGRFVEEHGLRYAHLNNDILDLVDSEAGRKAMGGAGPLDSLRWIVEAARLFKPIFRRALAEEWEAARGAEAIIYHPQAVGGYHIAEALGIPGIMADPLPTWVPTAAFPNLVLPDLKLGGWYNRLTYRMMPVLTRAMYGSVVTRWRREVLGLGRRPLFADELTRPDGQPMPILLGFSPSVVPRPPDWPANVEVTGYWILDEEADWEPPSGLREFLDAGPPPVFVGFGSMAGRDPARTTRIVLEALNRAGQRGVIATGWGGLGPDDAPADVFVVDSVPYDWLFPRVAAVVHHGGAGTTAAGLRAGRPSILCPFVADQPFWGRRVASLGAGPPPIPQSRLNAIDLAAAIRVAITDDRIRERAANLGDQLRGEDGAATAAALINRSLAGQS